jgi:protein arginine kinase activator
MLCQDCNEQPAVIVFTQIINKEKTVLRLCKDCAEKRGLHAPLTGSNFPIGELLAGMAEEEGKVEAQEMKKLVCSQCGLSYNDFKKAGRLGCSECYETFADGLKALLRKIHGSNQHLGKIPTFQKEHVQRKKEIRKLRDALKKAIKAEEFEKAAALRDRIHEMERVCQTKR